MKRLINFLAVTGGSSVVLLGSGCSVFPQVPGVNSLNQLLSNPLQFLGLG